ncbi:hypothetical protein [Bifidobacterium moraviense]|nr:hypothetical protein [Bifidobacterium sp. DSM 109958]
MFSLSRRRGGHYRSGFMVLCIILMPLCACGFSDASSSDDGPAVDPSHPYALEFRNSYARATNPLVKGMLRDGEISEAEINEFADVFAQCMSDKGLDWSWSNGEGETILLGKDSNITTEQMLEREQQCYDETDYMNIMPLYTSINGSNPNNLSSDDFNKQVLQCLKDNGLIDRDLDPDYFLSFYSAPGGFNSSEYKRYITPLQDEHDPGYDAAKSERFWQCVDDPMSIRK